MPSCLFVNHIHPTTSAYISPIEKWDLQRTYIGLETDLERTWSEGRTKDERRQDLERKIRQKEFARQVKMTKMIWWGNWHEA